jgi:hypothetical protein
MERERWVSCLLFPVHHVLIPGPGFSEDGESVSLSQRERARVREMATITQNTDSKSEASTN